MNRWLMLPAVIVVASVVSVSKAAAQPSGPLVPAITPEQVKASEALAATCDRVLAAASEVWLMEVAPRLGGASSGLIEGIRAHAFMYNNVHDAEDYGTITIYLRLQGLVPPSSALHPPAPPK